MSYVGLYATAMIVSIQIPQAQRGLVALITGLILTFAFTGVAINYGGSHFKGLFWMFFPFWTSQAFTSSMYRQLAPQYNIELFNSPFNSKSPFVRDIGFAALTGVIVL